MGLIGSNTDPSLQTGIGSVLTASGLCAPFPGLFVEDAGSLKTTGFNVPTASQSSCALQPPDIADMMYWFEPDQGVTKNGSNQVSLWLDLAPHHRDILPQNFLRSLRPTSQWPVYTAGVFPSGLAGMASLPGTGPNTGTLMSWVPPGNPPNQPTNDGAAVTMLGVGLASSALGGILATLRGTSYDLEMGYRHANTFETNDATFYASINADHNCYVNSPAVTYASVVVVMSLEFINSSTPPNVRVNGSPITFTGDNPPYMFAGVVDGGFAGHDYAGNAGFGIGWIPSTDAGHFAGYIGPQMCYLGVNHARTLAAEAYLRKRVGV